MNVVPYPLDVQRTSVEHFNKEAMVNHDERFTVKLHSMKYCIFFSNDGGDTKGDIFKEKGQTLKVVISNGEHEIETSKFFGGKMVMYI